MKGTQIRLCKCRAAESLDGVPGAKKTTTAQARPNPAGNEERPGRREGDRRSRERGGEGGDGVVGRDDHKETERQIFHPRLGRSFQCHGRQVMTVAHNYSFNCSHTDTHTQFLILYTNMLVLMKRTGPAFEWKTESVLVQTTCWICDLY